MSLPTTAKALTITNHSGGVDALKFANVELPKTLGPKDVFVKIKAVSLNYRDLIIPEGIYPFPLSDKHIVCASDGSGEVIAVGSDVHDYKVGDKVVSLFNQGHQYGPLNPVSIKTGLGGAIDGVLREYAVLPESGLLPLPKNLNFEEGATLPCAALTAWNALYGLKPIKPGDSVLIQGTGGVSIFGLQFAKAAGAFVVATTSSDEKAKALKALGADHVINYRTTPEWGVAAKALTPNGAGFDNIVEVGGTGTLEQSYKAIKLEATISMIGFVGGVKDNENSSSLGPLSTVCTVRGIFVGSKDMMEDMNRCIEANNIHPVVDKKTFTLDTAVDAYKYQKSQAHIGKVVIKINQ